MMNLNSSCRPYTIHMSDFLFFMIQYSDLLQYGDLFAKTEIDEWNTNSADMRSPAFICLLKSSQPHPHIALQCMSLIHFVSQVGTPNNP